MNTIESHQATLSLLDHLNSRSKNNIFSEIIAASQEQYKATLEKYGYGAAGAAGDSIYSKIETSSSNLMDSILALKDESLYLVKEGEEYDPSGLLKAVSNFASAYNTNLSNITSSGKAISNTFLPEMDEAFAKGSDKLSEIGINRDDDGRLIIDQDKLKAADPGALREALGSGSEFMAALYKSMSSMNEIVSSALSYMSGYGPAGGSTDLGGMIQSSFNSLG